MNKLIKKELEKVSNADLSHFDPAACTFHIPRKRDIQIKRDKCYLVYLTDAFFADTTLKVNWNNNSVPSYRYLKIDVSNIMAKMIKVVGVGYDFDNKQDIPYFWNGWLSLDKIKVLEEI